MKGPLARGTFSAAWPSRWGMAGRIPLTTTRIDLLTSLLGVTFEQAAMIHNKRASGRTKDLADAEVLEELRSRRPTAP